MQRQPLEDGVGRLAFLVQGEAGEVQLGRRDGLDRGAIGFVVAGREHLLGIDRQPDIAAARALEGAAQLFAVAAEDQHRLAEQRHVEAAARILVRRADDVRRARGDRAGEERGDVELLPGGKVGPHGDRDLGVELHGRMGSPGRPARS